MFFQIYRQSRIGILLALVFLILSTPLFSSARDTELSGQKLAAIFPGAKKFVQRDATLTPEQIAAIEKELGTELQSEDLKPIFYILLDGKNEPMGLVLCNNTEGPNGIIEGAVGLDIAGKVVKVVVYEHKESSAIAEEAFLKQFVGMGIDDTFKVGVDVDAIDRHEAAAGAVALLPKKTLLMSYALFLKQKSKPGPEEENART